MQAIIYSNIVFYSAVAAGVAMILAFVCLLLFWGETPNPDEEIDRILDQDDREN